jgi:hypothetical protein
LDSATINYPRSDTLVPAIDLAEICEIEKIDSLNIQEFSIHGVGCN